MDREYYLRRESEGTGLRNTEGNDFKPEHRYTQASRYNETMQALWASGAVKRITKEQWENNRIGPMVEAQRQERDRIVARWNEKHNEPEPNRFIKRLRALISWFKK